MRTRIRWFTVPLALALALLASPAMAIFACEDCEPSMPATTRCIGVCNGQIVRFCTDWFFLGCGNGFAPAEPRTADEAEQAFIRSLQLEPAGTASEPAGP